MCYPHVISRSLCGFGCHGSAVICVLSSYEKQMSLFVFCCYQVSVCNPRVISRCLFVSFILSTGISVLPTCDQQVSLWA